LSLVKNSLHGTTLPCKISSVERAIDTVILYYYPTLLSPVLDLTFDNDVQCKSAGWNILDRSPIDSKFHNHFMLHQGFHTMGLRPNLAHEAVSSTPKTFWTIFTKNLLIWWNATYTETIDHITSDVRHPGCCVIAYVTLEKSVEDLWTANVW